jgi:hypothetical protein
MDTVTDTGIIAVPDAKLAGRVTWWRLRGEVDWTSLRDAWVAAGLAEDLLPATITPSKALQRAVVDLKAPHRMVRPLPKGAGYQVVIESENAGEWDYTTSAKIALDVATNRPTLDPGDHALTVPLLDAFDRHLASLATTDISEWLSHLADYLRAVPLRDRGGVYFIPRHNVAEWDRMVAVIKAVSGHHVAGIPALQSADAVEAILDAVEAEAEAEVARIEDKLGGGELGARALKTQIAHSEAVEAKMSEYESLLGDGRLDRIRERLGALQANLAAAALAATVGEAAA